MLFRSLFNSVVSNTVPANGYSLVNSDNTIKCILPSNGVVIQNSADNKNLLISATITSLSSATNYTVGGLIVNNDTSIYGNLNVGTTATNKNIILNGDLYFGDPATTGVNFSTKIRQLIYNILSPMAPLIWFDNPLTTDKLYLKLDPNGNFLFGSVTTNTDLTVFGTSYLCGLVTIGNDTVSANTIMNGNLTVGTSTANRNIILYGNLYFGNPNTNGITIDQKISNSINDIIYPVSPLKWARSEEHTSELQSH